MQFDDADSLFLQPMYEMLTKAGYDTAEKIAAASDEDLSHVKLSPKEKLLYKIIIKQNDFITKVIEYIDATDREQLDTEKFTEELIFDLYDAATS
jgi:hypothetical protein